MEIEREAISPPWSREALLEEMNREDSFFVVAANATKKEDNTGEPSLCVGFAILRQVGDDGEVLQVAVDSPARRRGVGDALIAAALDYAVAHEFESVFLEVRSGNAAAVRLYEKHGFSTVRVREGYYDSPVEDAVVMAKEL